MPIGRVKAEGPLLVDTAQGKQENHFSKAPTLGLVSALRLS